ncbi:polyprotein [Senna tora]|uniref:Polyprotein n=1 Tax=Senna tora TaxID=362788 RepID=A0A834SEC4_9FABA|nr:polyprotein [Senna tora]
MMKFYLDSAFITLIGEQKPAQYIESSLPLEMLLEDTPVDLKALLQQYHAVFMVPQPRLHNQQISLQEHPPHVKVGNHIIVHVPLPLLTTKQGPVVSSFAILATQQVQVGTLWETDVLVTWEDLSPPTLFDIEDKVNGGADVMHRKPLGQEEGNEASGQLESDPGKLVDQQLWKSLRMKRPTWHVTGNVDKRRVTNLERV